MRRMHNQMDILSAGQVEGIYRITDQLDLHRDWIVVPINAAPEGSELQQPDGKILIRPAQGDRFELWLFGLRERLERLDLGRVPRREENDPKFPLTGPGGIHPVGTRRYLGDRGVIR
jgi:hypothetical protein